MRDGTALGTLRVVGVGPGDPELMTLRAHRLIGASPVVAYPAAEGRESAARAIAAGSIARGAEEIAMPAPMRVERGPAQAAWEAGAARIAAALASGRDVALLCEGDPLFYGSAMYLVARLAGRFEIDVTPGVAAPAACAAAARAPLVARDEALTILPATLPEVELGRRLAAADAAVVMKLGRHVGKARRALAALGRLDGAIYVAEASRPGERVAPLAEAPDPAPYFSLALCPGRDAHAAPTPAELDPA